jgi:hypothetical protein
MINLKTMTSVSKYFYTISVIILVGLGLFTVKYQVQSVDAQFVEIGEVLVVSNNSTTRQSHIWKINPVTNTIESLWALDFLSSETPNDIFPQVELDALNSAVAQGSFLQGTADNLKVGRRFQAAWLLEPTLLLALTGNEVCDRVAGGCFGYYEFLLIDSQTNSVSSLSKISYHDSLLADWECTPDVLVTMGEVLPNPKYSTFAFTIYSSDTCGLYLTGTHTYIIQYSSTSILYELDMAAGISWSPNGEKLAYYTRTNCATPACDTTVNVLDVNSGAVSSLREGLHIYNQPMFTVWLDNEFVMYQWLVSPTGGEGTLTVFWHNTSNGNEFSHLLDKPFLATEMYYLENGGASLLGIRNDQIALGLSAQPNWNPVTTISNITRIFYNSKYNSYVFTNSAVNGVMNIVHADLNTSTIDLRDIIPPDEAIAFVSPGNIQN